VLTPEAARPETLDCDCECDASFEYMKRKPFSGGGFSADVVDVLLPVPLTPVVAGAAVMKSLAVAQCY